MDSHYEDTINFGREEANRMHATYNPGWDELRKWLHTTTGQEFLDEMVYGAVGLQVKDALLESVNLPTTQANREYLDRICNKLLSEGL